MRPRLYACGAVVAVAFGLMTWPRIIGPRPQAHDLSNGLVSITHSSDVYDHALRATETNGARNEIEAAHTESRIPQTPLDSEFMLVDPDTQDGITTRIGELVDRAEHGSNDAIWMLGMSTHQQDRIKTALRGIAGSLGHSLKPGEIDIKQSIISFALAKLGDSLAFEDVVKRSLSKNYAEQELALDGLAYIGDEQSKNQLIRLLNSSDGKRPLFSEIVMENNSKDQSPSALPVRYSALLALHGLNPCPQLGDDPDLWTETDIAAGRDYYKIALK